MSRPSRYVTPRRGPRDRALNPLYLQKLVAARLLAGTDGLGKHPSHLTGIRRAGEGNMNRPEWERERGKRPAHDGWLSSVLVPRSPGIEMGSSGWKCSCCGAGVMTWKRRELSGRP